MDGLEVEHRAEKGARTQSSERYSFFAGATNYGLFSSDQFREKRPSKRIHQLGGCCRYNRDYRLFAGVQLIEEDLVQAKGVVQSRDISSRECPVWAANNRFSRRASRDKRSLEQ